MILVDLNSANDRPIYGRIADQLKSRWPRVCSAGVTWCPRCGNCRSSLW